MSRFIDADKLSDWIKRCANPYGRPTLDYDTSLKVMDMIDRMTDVSGREWIPITEKQPKPLEYCLVTLEVKGEPVVDVAYRYEDKFFYPEDSIGEKDKAFTIIAWMPLPGPYKPEGGSH